GAVCEWYRARPVRRGLHRRRRRGRPGRRRHPGLPHRRPGGRRGAAHVDPRLAGPPADPRGVPRLAAEGAGRRGDRRRRRPGGGGAMRFVAVTSCPTGIAHTYMAAEALEQAARSAGHEIAVETQGAAGSDPIDPAVIAAADAVIYAADLEVKDKGRFAGKPFV